MTPELILAFVQGAIRLGQAARSAYEQSVRNAGVPLPPPLPTMVAPLVRVQQYFGADGPYHDRVAPPAALAAYWDSGLDGYVDRPDARAALIAAAIDIDRGNADGADWRRRYLSAAEPVVLAQWADGSKPPPPWVRVAMAMVGVALDYAAAHPGFLADGANGSKLVGALAQNLSALLPDPGVSAQVDFAERLVAITLEAGFKTLADLPDAVVTSERLQKLVQGLAAPLAEAFARCESDGERLRWEGLRDRLFPKLAEAGLGVLIDYQKDFLGARFDPDGRTGALTQAFLVAVKDVAIADGEGWLPLYRSLLKAVAARTDKIVRGSESDDVLYRQLLGELTSTLAEAPTPFAEGWTTELAVGVLDCLNRTLPLRTDTPWGKVAADTVRQVLAGLADGLKSGRAIGDILTPQAALDLVGVVVGDIAATPGLLTGAGGGDELRAVVAAVFGAMAADKGLLLGTDGWKTIVAVAVAEAARNPARLFRLDVQTPEQQLGARLIATLLDNAAAAFADGGRQSGAVLFGDTLAQAVAQTLTAAAGNAERAAANLEGLDLLCTRLNALATGPEGRIGAREWQWLFRRMVAGVLETGTLDYTTDDLRKMLVRGDMA